MTDSSLTPNISIRRLAKLLKKFHVEDGDIIALKHTTWNANLDTIEQLAKAFEHLEKNIIVVVVDSFDDMSVLNEKAMNERGWFRLEKLLKAIETKPIKDKSND